MRTTFLALILLLAAGSFLLWSFLTTPRAVLEMPTPAPTVAVLPTETLFVVEEGGCSAEIPIPGGFLIEGVVGAPVYPNPILSDPNPIDRMLVDLLFDGLVRMDARGLPQPALAEGWTVSEDGKALRFTLRSDAMWHDGQPVTSDDILFSYGLLAEANLPNGVSALWQTVQMTAIDARTVEFVLSEPYAPFLEAVSRGVVPVHLLRGTSAAELTVNTFNNRPIGTGPFLVANDWVADGVLRLTPNSAYWGDVDLDGIEIRFFASDANLATAYLSNEVDALGLISAEAFAELASLPELRLFSSAEAHTTQLFFNIETGAMADQRVRTAVAHSIDRPQLINEVVNGQGLPFNGPYPPNSWAANTAFPLFPTNTISATTLLNEANWSIDEATGLRQRLAGETVETLQLTLLTLDTPRQQATAAMLQAQLALNAIEVELDVQPFDAYLAALSARAFDMAIIDVLPLQDPDLYDFWSQEAIVIGQNYAGWNNRRASESLEIARQLYDPAERFEYYAGFNQAFAEDLPALGLYQAVQSYGLRESVVAAGSGSGVIIGRISSPRDRYVTLRDWRVDSAEVAVPCD